MKYLFLDTNIFIHYKSFEDIPWKSLINTTDDITISLASIVLREIDKHKDSSKSRIKEKARKLSKKINNILIQHQQSRIPLMYCRETPITEKEKEIFDISVNDDRFILNVLHSSKKMEDVYVVSNDTDLILKAQDAGINVLYMDETTFSFSRKVLDRAMTIEMNEVDLTGGLDKKHEEIGKLDKTHLIGTAVEGCDVYNAYKADCNTAIAYLNAVNQHLEKTPFKVAYRTRNEFLLYVVNNLPYNKDKDGNDVQHGWLLARALDEITCMKVLSRIEGDETKVSKEFLSKLKGEIKSQLEKLGECTYTAIRAEENKENNVWYSKSLDKLDEMTKRLESGYTSFWS